MQAAGLDIHKAIEEGDLAVVRAVCQYARQRVNDRNRVSSAAEASWGVLRVAHCQHDRTLLHEAAYAGRVEIVQMLLDAKADPKALSRGSQTPLDKARLKDQNEAVVALLVQATC